MRYFTKLSLLISMLVTSLAWATPVYVGDGQGNLGTVDTSGNVNYIGNMGTTMYDIAMDNNGNLWGISSRELYSIDANTGSATLVGALGHFANALVFGNDGTLYAAGNSSLFSVDIATGVASIIGDIGFRSSGDLEFDDNNQLYMSDINGNLIGVDYSNGAGSLIGAMGISNAYGLAFVNGSMFAYSGNDIYGVDLATGATQHRANYAGRGLSVAFGATAGPDMISIPEPGGLLLFALTLLGMSRFRK